MIPFADLRVTATLWATLLSCSCIQDGAACNIDAPCQGATTCQVATGRCVPKKQAPDARLITDGATPRVERRAYQGLDRGSASGSESLMAPEMGVDWTQKDSDQKDHGAAFIPCFDDSECPTGYCVHHVCCDIPCQVPCVSCAVPGQVGICTPVPCDDKP